nr:MerR family transcriptional regulator [Actinomycetales bacterium]
MTDRAPNLRRVDPVNPGSAVAGTGRTERGGGENPGPAADGTATEANDEWLTVGQVAEACGISVRTLHHWDQIGIAQPSGRTHADYRLYSAEDVARIQRVLVYRELEIPLAAIAELLDDREQDSAGHLLRQRELLNKRISRLQEIVSAVDLMLEEDMDMQPRTAKEQAEVFGKQWEAEAEERWGESDAWRQSRERSARLSGSDWERIKQQGDTLNAQLGAAVAEGVEPGSEHANALVERHRAMVSDFYDCTHAMQVLLGRMYIQDPRFTATYEAVQPGLAQWLTTAIDANALAKGVDPDTAQWG